MNHYTEGAMSNDNNVWMCVAYDDDEIVESPFGKDALYFSYGINGVNFYCALKRQSDAKLMAGSFKVIAERLGKFDWETMQLPSSLWAIGMKVPGTWLGDDDDKLWTVVKIDALEGSFTLENDGTSRKYIP